MTQENSTGISSRTGAAARTTGPDPLPDGLPAPSTGASPLVSVIVPSFNSQDHVAETIRSVLAQTMADLEIIAVDDASTDSTADVLAGLAAQDPRVTVLVQGENQGVARARNRGLEAARGRYIAYLDSDDLWVPTKLERQLAFMRRTRAGACITSYETIEENGEHRNYVHAPRSFTYKQFLKNTMTCTLSVMFDTTIVDRSLLVMPDLRRGQDAATWLKVMRRGHRFHGLDECLAKYRKTAGSLSSNKVKAVKRTWHLYRNVERLPRPYAAYCLTWQLSHAMIRRRRSS
ncbi:glycosyltransferase family 2 protein [Actinomyces timonensis]|uniref:glycosyltransferase family 2 protein n=1 Tax=Actinomyces timonensis TaxID=1288391 RepID=UPI0002F7E6C2|nr:glycosyltransferase family 2 protein [Actinomyces timonensis]